MEWDRDGNDLYLFVDGQLIQQFEITGTIPYDQDFTLTIPFGDSPTFLDEYRFSTVARHTTPFTPPTEAYSEDENTVVAGPLAATGVIFAPMPTGLDAYETVGGPYTPVETDTRPSLCDGVTAPCEIHDNLEASGYQELRAALGLSDSVYMLQLSAIMENRFDGYLIQYRQDRW